MSGLLIIARERIRQRREEGYNAWHDDKHFQGELAKAAACYAMPPSYRDTVVTIVRWLWPFDISWWKPSPKNRIKELAKAGALIAAEIDRLEREDL